MRYILRLVLVLEAFRITMVTILDAILNFTKN